VITIHQRYTDKRTDGQTDGRISCSHIACRARNLETATNNKQFLCKVLDSSELWYSRLYQPLPRVYKRQPSAFCFQ